MTRLGRYELRRPLGAGGMGSVWAAHDLELDRAVALKLISAERVHDSNARLRFAREARALARLRHANVVTVYDVATFDDTDAIVMELVDGQTLGTWVRGTRPRWQEVLGVLVAAGRGLAAAHAAGMVHRDVKPDNVLVARDGRVVVTDFGLARSVASTSPPSPSSAHRLTAKEIAIVGQTVREPDRAGLDGMLTSIGAIVGTPAYMAPEQLAGRDVSMAADQFAFCVMAWEALTGARPFAGDTAEVVFEAMRRGEVTGTVPPALRATLVRGLAFDPAARWPSMDALLAALAVRPRRWALPAVLALAACIGVGIAFASTHDSQATAAHVPATVSPPTTTPPPNPPPVPLPPIVVIEQAPTPPPVQRTPPPPPPKHPLPVAVRPTPAPRIVIPDSPTTFVPDGVHCPDGSKIFEHLYGCGK